MAFGYTDIEQINRMWEESLKEADKRAENIKNGRCEVCGDYASMHEGKRHFCLKHWREWVMEATL